MKLSDLETRDSMIAAVRMRNEDGEVIIEIQENPDVFISKSQREEASDPEGELAKAGFYRWAAGGVLHVLNQNGRRYIALILRDSEAPSYGGYLSIPSGISESKKEWFDLMTIVVREGFEEIAIIWGENKLLIPDLGSGYCEGILWETYLTQAEHIRSMGFEVKPGKLESHFLPAKNDQILNIICGERKVRIPGVLVKDRLTNGLDLLIVAETKIPEGDEMRFIDCEKTGEGFLARDIVVFPVNRISTSSDRGTILEISGASSRFRRGKKVDEVNSQMVFPVTPVTEAALKMILRK